MSGFDDLIPAAMPYMATESIHATAGSDWEWDYRLKDKAGDLVVISPGFTFSVKLAVKNSDGSGTVVYTAATSNPNTTTLRCKVANDVTEDDEGATYYHEVTITRDSDGKKVTVVGAFDSTFLVKRKVS